VPPAGDQHGSAAGGGASRNVAHAIADKNASLQVKAVLFGRALQHTGPRFTAGAMQAILDEIGVGVMRTKVSGVRPRSAGTFDAVGDNIVQAAEFRLANQSSGDGGLVGDYD